VRVGVIHRVRPQIPRRRRPDGAGRGRASADYRVLDQPSAVPLVPADRSIPTAPRSRPRGVRACGSRPARASSAPAATAGCAWLALGGPVGPAASTTAGGSPRGVVLLHAGESEGITWEVRHVAAKTPATRLSRLNRTTTPAIGPMSSMALAATCGVSRSKRQGLQATEAPPLPYLERYLFNPLTARPLLRLRDGRLLAPVLQAIGRKLSLIELYYLGIKRWGEAFARDMGELLEDYIGRQLASMPSVDVHPEIAYTDRRDVIYSVDWIVVFDDLCCWSRPRRPGRPRRRGQQT
jgi:hypothetical protein